MEPGNETHSMKKCWREWGEGKFLKALYHPATVTRQAQQGIAAERGQMYKARGKVLPKGHCSWLGSLWEQDASHQLAGWGKAGQAVRMETGTFQGLVCQ